MRKCALMTTMAVLTVLGVLAPAAGAAGGAQQWLSRYDGPGHSSDVAHSIAASPDGSKVYVTGTSHGTFASAQDYGTVAYDAKTGAQLWVARYDFRPDCCGVDRAVALALSPDGRRLYVTGESGNAPVTTTVAYDAATGAQLWVARSSVAAPPSAIVVSRDGASVYVAGTSGFNDYSTLAYDAATGAQRWSASYDGAAHGNDGAAAVGVSPDGTRVFVTGTSEEVAHPRVRAATTIAYDAANGSQRWIDHLSVNDLGSGKALAVAPNGARVYITGDANGQPATVGFDAATGNRLWMDVSSNGGGTAIATNPGGTRVYTTGARTVARDAASGQEVWNTLVTAPGSDLARVRGLAVSSDGARVYITGTNTSTATAEDYATVGYDASNGAAAWTASYNGPASSSDLALGLAVSPDASRVFVTGSSIDQQSDYATIAYDTGVSAGRAVPVDVRPSQCPNPLKLSSTQALTIAIAGTSTLDARQIDPASVRIEGVASVGKSLGDVTTPYVPYTGKTRADQCAAAGHDGIGDLALQFSIPSLAAALGPHRAGETVVLHMRGSLKDGTPIVGEDVVVIG